MRAKQPDRAIAFLQSILQKTPDNAEALAPGLDPARERPPLEAVKSFQAAIDRQPESMVGYRALPTTIWARKPTDEALKVIRAGFEAQPELRVAALVRRRAGAQG